MYCRVCCLSAEGISRDLSFRTGARMGYSPLPEDEEEAEEEEAEVPRPQSTNVNP